MPGVVPVVRLTEVFRQAADSRIISTANRIRQGLMPVESTDANSDFFMVERDEPEKIAATLITVVKERIPEAFRLDPIRDVQVLCPMNRGSLEQEITIRYDDRLVKHDFGELDEVSLAYADCAQGARLGVPGSSCPAGHPALHAAVAEPYLHGHHQGQAAGCPGRAAEGAGDRGQGGARPEALVEATTLAIKTIRR